MNSENTKNSQNATQGLQAQFAAHIRNPDTALAPEGIEPRRLKIYRDLIFRNVESFISGGFPVLHSLYSESDWHDLIQDFLEHHVCHTPYFLEISEEFLAFLQNTRDEANDPPFLLELAHYEWIELALDVAPESVADLPFAVSDIVEGELMKAVLVPNPVLWSLAYRYPVHQIGPDFQPDEAPQTLTYLVVYRDSDNDVNFVQINAATSRLLALLRENIEEAGGFLSAEELVLVLAQEMAHQDSDGLLSFAASLIDQWYRQGIILGCAVIDRAGSLRTVRNRTARDRI